MPKPGENLFRFWLKKVKESATPCRVTGRRPVVTSLQVQDSVLQASDGVPLINPILPFASRLNFPFEMKKFPDARR
jgi:hypothetical protein